MSSACRLHLHVVCMSSGHVIHTHTCHPHIICSIPHGQHGPKLSFYFDRIWLLNGICPCHLHVVHTCTHHLLVIFTTPHIPYYPELSFCTLSTHMHIVNVICILFRNAYVMYMSSLLLLSAYVHVIYILSGHICIMCTLYKVVLDIFLTDNTNIIHTSSLVLFIYSIMYNLVSAHCLHRCTLSMSFACCLHMYTSFAFHL